MSKIVEWEDVVLKVDLYLAGNSEHTFDVEVLESVWPRVPDYVLIALCDGADPNMPEEDQQYTGGEVDELEPNKFHVKVFHD